MQRFKSLQTDLQQLKQWLSDNNSAKEQHSSSALLTALVHLRCAQLYDQLLMSQECRTHLQAAEPNIVPTRSLVESNPDTQTLTVYLELAELLHLFGRSACAKILLRIAEPHCESQKRVFHKQQYHQQYQRLVCRILHEEGQSRRAFRIEASLATNASSLIQWSYDLTRFIRSIGIAAQQERTAVAQKSILNKQSQFIHEIIHSFNTILKNNKKSTTKNNNNHHQQTQHRAHQSIAFAQCLLASCLVHYYRYWRLLPIFPITFNRLATVVTDPCSMSPIPQGQEDPYLEQLGEIQRAYQEASSLLDDSSKRWKQIEEDIYAAQTYIQHANLFIDYATLFSARHIPTASYTMQTNHTEPSPSLTYPYLRRALNLYTQAIDILNKEVQQIPAASTESALSTPDQIIISHPLQRVLTRTQSKVGRLYLKMQQASETEITIKSSSANNNTIGAGVDDNNNNNNNNNNIASAIDAKTVSELEASMMVKWMEEYEDVFKENEEIHKESPIELSVSMISSSLGLYKDEHNEYLMGRIRLALMKQQKEEQERLIEKRRKAERRAKEQEAWRKRIYGLDIIEAQEAERQRQERDKAEAAERQRKEEEDATMTAKAAEEERIRKEEEEKQQLASQAKGNKGKSKAASLLTPAAASKNNAAAAQADLAEQAARAVAEAQRLQQEREWAERLLKEQQDAEDSAFNYDNTEWSPVYLLQWKRELDRDREDSRSGREAQEEKKSGAKRDRVRQPSASSFPSDEDDGLDPTILNDIEFPTPSMNYVTYQHLITALNTSLTTEDYSLIAETSLSLVGLFTTRYPLLSSKYLALHLSAITSDYTMKLMHAIAGEGQEMLIIKKKQRLLKIRDIIENADHADDYDDHRTYNDSPASYCNEAEVKRINEWLESSSLISSWCRVMVDGESDGEDNSSSLLKGYDASYAQMLVSIPYSVSILTILYHPDDHSIYLSLLSSTAFPASSRFSRTSLSVQDEESLQQQMLFFKSLNILLTTHLSTPSHPQSIHALLQIEQQYIAAITIITNLLSICCTRALITEEFFIDRDLIILTDHLLFDIPYEAISIFRYCKSLSRDFSLSSFSQRLSSSSASPINKDSVGYIVDSHNDDKTHRLYNLFHPLIQSSWQGKHGQDMSILRDDWPRLMLASTEEGAFFYIGYDPLFYDADASQIACIDVTGIRLMILLDKTINEHSRYRLLSSAKNKNTIDRIMADELYSTVLLLSTRGINSLLCHQYSLTEKLSYMHIHLVTHCLSNGQSVANIIKLLQNIQEINLPDPLQPNNNNNNNNSNNSQTTSSSTHNLKSPKGKNSNKPQLPPTSPKTIAPNNSTSAAINTNTADGGNNNMNKDSNNIKFNDMPAAEYSNDSKVENIANNNNNNNNNTIYMFDRYNTILIGLPHWRM